MIVLLWPYCCYSVVLLCLLRLFYSSIAQRFDLCVYASVPRFCACEPCTIPRTLLNIALNDIVLFVKIVK